MGVRVSKRVGNGVYVNVGLSTLLGLVGLGVLAACGLGQFLVQHWATVLEFVGTVAVLLGGVAVLVSRAQRKDQAYAEYLREQQEQ